MSMWTVTEIADKLNAQAESLARELLPNGRKAGNKWMASGIADTGRSESLYVHLSGPAIGHWRDMGNCPAGEERGDMIDLLRLKLGLDKVGAIQEAKQRLGIDDAFVPGQRGPDPAELARRAEEARARAAARDAAEADERARKARGAKALYLRGLPIAGTAAEAYLLNRGLLNRALNDIAAAGEWPGALRFNAEVWCKPEGVKVPAMLAAIYGADGAQMGTHRTFLQACPRRGWCKIDSPNAKMVLGNMWGGFIPINKGSSGKPMAKMPEGEPVYVTEGIEDALVVRMMRPEARIVAAISLANMGGIVLPPAARKLVLVCDRDTKPKAQEALERAIARQQARGLDVQLVLPPPPHKDMNDWLKFLLVDRADVRPSASMPPVSEGSDFRGEAA